MRKPACRLLLAALLLCAGSAVHAMGGHFWVDDAVLLDPGQCQLETWAEREQGGARTLVHVGPGCRVGPVELGVSWERSHRAGEDSGRTVAPQLKWAHPLDDRWSVGLVLTGLWQTGSGYQGSTVLVPLTWHAGDKLQVHLNLGRDVGPGAVGRSRGGAALEWAPSPKLSLIAERFRENDAQSWRVGTRWSVQPDWSIDLSRATPLHGPTPAWWTLGLNLSFGR